MLFVAKFISHRFNGTLTWYDATTGYPHIQKPPYNSFEHSHRHYTSSKSGQLSNQLLRWECCAPTEHHYWGNTQSAHAIRQWCKTSTPDSVWQRAPIQLADNVSPPTINHIKYLIYRIHRQFKIYYIVTCSHIKRRNTNKNGDFKHKTLFTLNTLRCHSFGWGTHNELTHIGEPDLNEVETPK